MRIALFAIFAFIPNVLPLIVGTELTGNLIVILFYLLLVPLAMTRSWKWPIILMSSATNIINENSPVPMCIILALIYVAIYFRRIKSALTQAKPLSIFLGLSMLSFLGSMPFAVVRGASPLGISRLYVIYFVAPIALVLMGMTFKVPRSHVGLWITILIFYAAATWLAFFFLGQPEISIPDALNPRLNAVYYTLGKATVIFWRTQISIPMAATAAACLAIALIGNYLYSAIPLFCLIFLIMLRLGSVGSILALAASGILTILFWLLGAVKRKLRNRKRILAFLVIAAAALILVQIRFREEAGYFIARLEVKYDGFRQYGLEGIDRYPYWATAVRQIKENPLGEGWSTATRDENWTYPHNDYLVYAISYGIIGGVTYFALVVWLLITGIKKTMASLASDWEIANGLILVGVGSVIFLNSFIDHLVANRWGYSIVWALIALAFMPQPSLPEIFDNKHHHQPQA